MNNSLIACSGMKSAKKDVSKIKIRSFIKKFGFKSVFITGKHMKFLALIFGIKKYGSDMCCFMTRLVFRELIVRHI